MKDKINSAREVDVFNRYSRHNKTKVVGISIIIAIVAIVAVYFFAKSTLTYTIKFVANGGTVFGEALKEEYEYKFLQRTELPEGLKRPGYYIDGFYTDEEMTKEFKFGKRIWNSATIYIDWRPGYAVLLSFVEGEDDDDRVAENKTGINEQYLKTYYEQYVNIGSTYTVPDIYNDIEGSKHYGEKLLWYYDIEGKGEPIDTNTFEVNEDIQIYGKWFDDQESNFEVDENGVLQRYLGNCVNLILPNKIKEIKNITGTFQSGDDKDDPIADRTNTSVFYRVIEDLKIVYVNKDMQKLGRYAFKQCEELEIVKFLGNNITTIPEACFEGCRMLEQIELPTSIEHIGADAFNTCAELTNITGLNNVKTLEAGAFVNCYDLKRLELNNLQTVGGGAFAMCMALEELCFGSERVAISGGVTSDGVFEGASSNFEILIPDSQVLMNYYQTEPKWNGHKDKFKFAE